jgi:glycosyltransferase involved in cell wall biosynthesis
MPKVSVIVVTYNRAHLLGACLESISRQTYRDFEVVLVDDGSTDDTAEVAAAFAPLARYFWQENQGIPGALNRAIREARGEYIGFADSDDALLPEALETEAHILDENPSVGLVYGQTWEMNEKGVVTSLRKPGFARGSFIRSGREEIRDFLFSCHITGSSMMVRKRCFDDVGLFDPTFSVYEDWDMWVRIAKNYDVAYVEKPVALYRVHSGPVGNIFIQTDLRMLERLRRLRLERTFEDPEIGHLYKGLRGKAFFRHHSLVAARACEANEMGLARFHIFQAFRARPRALFGSGGPGGVWMFLKTWVPAPVRCAGRRLHRLLGRLCLRPKSAVPPVVTHGVERLGSSPRSREQ